MRQLKKRGGTDDKHIAGVRRIDAEPEDIAKAIFDMALPNKEAARSKTDPIPPQIPLMKTDDKDDSDRDDEKEDPPTRTS